MAIKDTWHLRDGSRSKQFGQGKRWRVRWHEQSRSFDTKAAAERWWLNVRTQAPQVEVEHVRVSVLVDRWLATKKGLTVKGYTACRGAAAHVKDAWGSRMAGDIRHEEILSWFAAMDASPSLKHKVLQAFRGALDLTGMANPAAGVKLPPQRRRESRYLDWDELELLAKECRGYESLVWLLGTTGLRVGEACALNVGDVDQRRRRVRVRKSKSGIGRDAPVAPSVLTMLDLDRAKGEPLFTSRQGTRVLPDNWRARHFSRAVDRAHLAGMTIHDLRHTAASLAIADGADVKSVQRMLGHKDASMTLNVYTDLFDRSVDDVAARMDARFRGKSVANELDETH